MADDRYWPKGEVESAFDDVCFSAAIGHPASDVRGLLSSHNAPRYRYYK
jgi:hypothetical protein